MLSHIPETQGECSPLKVTKKNKKGMDARNFSRFVEEALVFGSPSVRHWGRRYATMLSSARPEFMLISATRRVHPHLSQNWLVFAKTISTRSAKKSKVLIDLTESVMWRALLSCWILNAGGWSRSPSLRCPDCGSSSQSFKS